MTTPNPYEATYQEELKKRREAGSPPPAATPSSDAAAGVRLGTPAVASSNPYEERYQRRLIELLPPPAPVVTSPTTPVPAPDKPPVGGVLTPQDERRRRAAARIARAGYAPPETGIPVFDPNLRPALSERGRNTLDWYQKNVTEPVGATLTVVQVPTPGIPGIARRGGFEFNPEQLPGRPGFREAYRENVPLGGRILTEIVADPLNLVPGIGFTKMRQLRLLGGRLGIRKAAKAGEVWHDILLRDETGKVWSMQMPDTAEAKALVDDWETDGTAIRLPSGYSAEESKAGVQRLRAGAAPRGLPEGEEIGLGRVATPETPPIDWEAEVNALSQDVLPDQADLRAYQAGVEAEIAQETVRDEPLRRLIRALGPSRPKFGETLTPKQALLIYHGGKTIGGTNADALAEVRRLYPHAITPEGRVRPEYALDDVVGEYGERYTHGDGVELLLRDIEAAKVSQKGAISQRVEAARLAEEAQSPVASGVPEPTPPTLKEAAGAAQKEWMTQSLGRLEKGDIVQFRPDGASYAVVGSRGRQVVVQDVQGVRQTISANTPVMRVAGSWKEAQDLAIERYSVPVREVAREVKAPPPEQVGAIQAGMGIGEQPAQGTLGLAGQEGISRPLIDAEQVAERQRLAAERAAGQAGLQEAVQTAVPSPTAGVPPPGQPPAPPIGDVPPTGAFEPRVPPEKDPVIQKALQVLKGVRRVSKREQAAMFEAERRVRFARGMAASENLPLREGFRPFFGAQAGAFPTPDIQPIVGQFTEPEINHLFARLEAPGVLRPGYDRNNAAAALADLLHPSTAKIPMPRDLALLERAFGSNFARQLYNKKRTASQAVWDEFIAAWNLPRSLVASLDLSATLRQGAILAPGNLTDWRASVVAELKAFRSETYAAKAWDSIYLHPNYERLTSAGLDLTQRGAVAPLLKREEAFMSRWAGRIPGVRASERAYVTMLNKLRFDVANKMLEGLVVKGLPEAELERQLTGVMDFINWTTGRGPTLPGGRTGASLQAVLNGVMFSPRFMTSRFATLTLPVTAYQNPAIRVKLAKDLVAWVSITSMAVGLAKAAGARVEIDPRSGEFGKIILGHTRYDPWAGMQPVGRLIAQLMWGQGKSSLGKVYSTDDEDLISKRQRLKSEGKMSDEEFAKSGRFLPARMNLMKRFLRSKLQPLAGEAWDQATGEDWLGGEAKPGQALSKDVRVNLFVQNLMPILAQDILDAVVAQQSPLTIAAASTASAVGVGASTYVTTADIAREEFPGLSLEELRRKPEATQKRWQREADRRRGVPLSGRIASKTGTSPEPVFVPVR